MGKERLDYYYQHDRLFKSEIDNDKDLKETYLIASRLEGFPRQIGTHAAGIVMCQKNLDEVLPLTKSDDMYLTSYSMNYLEDGLSRYKKPYFDYEYLKRYRRKPSY